MLPATWLLKIRGLNRGCPASPGHSTSTTGAWHQPQHLQLTTGSPSKTEAGNSSGALLRYTQLSQMAAPVHQQQAAVDLASLPQPLAVLHAHAESDTERGPETTYYVLGTAHVSTESCDDVAKLIRAVRPQVVMVELCAERKPILTADKTHVPTLSEVLTDIRTGRGTPFQAIYSWLLAKVARNLDVMPGEEFRVALREAHAIGAQVVLGDREVTVTLARVWHALSLWEKLKLTGTLLWTGLSMLDADEMRQEVEKMKETDVLTEAIREFGKEFPSLIVPLLTERDQFMAFMLRKLAARAHTVVAIVGAGHLQGIRENWEAEIDIHEITSMPEQRPPLFRWRRVALLTACGVVASTALLRYSARR